MIHIVKLGEINQLKEHDKNMKQFGLDAILKLPSTTKRRRVFSFLDTMGDDKELLQTMLKENYEDFLPKEIPVAKNIKNVDGYLQHWDMDVFYKEIVSLQANEGISKNVPVYIGDIDAFILWYGHYLFIEQKCSTEKISACQLGAYIDLARRYNATAWYIIGKPPHIDDKNLASNEYKLCVIESSGWYNIYTGNYSDIINYFRLWLQEGLEHPKTDIDITNDLVSTIINEFDKTGKHSDLSAEVALKEAFANRKF